MRLALRPGLHFIAAGRDALLTLDLAGERLLRGAPYGALLAAWRDGMTLEALQQALPRPVNFALLVGALRQLEQAGALHLSEHGDRPASEVDVAGRATLRALGQGRWILGVRESLARRVPVPDGESLLLLDDPRRSGAVACLERLLGEAPPVRVVVLGTPWALVAPRNDVPGLKRLAAALWEQAPLSYARQGHGQGLSVLPAVALRELPPGLTARLADPPERWWRCDARGGAALWPRAADSEPAPCSRGVLWVPGVDPRGRSAGLDLATPLRAFEPVADERLEALATPLVGIARDLRLYRDAQGLCHAAAHPALPFAALQAAAARGLTVPGCAGTGASMAAARRVCLAEVAERRSLAWHGDEARLLPARRFPGGEHDAVEGAPYLLGHPRTIGRADTSGCAVAGTFSTAVLSGLLEAVEREALARWREGGEPPLGWLESGACLRLAAPAGLAVVVALSGLGSEAVFLGAACRADARAAQERARAELAQQRLYGVREERLGPLPGRCVQASPPPAPPNLAQLLAALSDEGYEIRVFNFTRVALGIPCARVELLRRV
ncbi:YcaO-like family protein [Alkalilimnicola sp. S0819]|uniref:YcaO-like family protein n=1 Tax=Alkalilimnicola sp. S0819 TaxID=2613922 RepID=UPI001261DA82|nr:YcaO-like family protein [Alkalilimnicola sp. S0819]KAB7627792.1 hypothetical protein F3N43_02110 [Alkalilimnicola sp. S0819]MPQ15422.1 hypothetical protein [Alkalilimnicola sp. S0819]